MYGAPRHGVCEEYRSVHCTEAGIERLFVELPDRKDNLFRFVIGQTFKRIENIVLGSAQTFFQNKKSC
jgi:hypothetical protein